jgi:hypothetical protein
MEGPDRAREPPRHDLRSASHVQIARRRKFPTGIHVSRAAASLGPRKVLIKRKRRLASRPAEYVSCSYHVDSRS